MTTMIGRPWRWTMEILGRSCLPREISSVSYLACTPLIEVGKPRDFWSLPGSTWGSLQLKGETAVRSYSLSSCGGGGCCSSSSRRSSDSSGGGSSNNSGRVRRAFLVHMYSCPGEASAELFFTAQHRPMSVDTRERDRQRRQRF